VTGELAELVRIVTFRPREGEELTLQELVTSRAVEMNQRFGASSVWFLIGDMGMAIVSVWPRPGDLDTMRANPEYIELLQAIKAKSQDLTDHRYRLAGGSSSMVPTG